MPANPVERAVARIASQGGGERPGSGDGRGRRDVAEKRSGIDEQRRRDGEQRRHRRLPRIKGRSSTKEEKGQKRSGERGEDQRQEISQRPVVRIPRLDRKSVV